MLIHSIEITEEDEEKESEGQASEGEHNEANDKSVPKDDPQESVAAQRPLDQEYGTRITKRISSMTE